MPRQELGDQLDEIARQVRQEKLTEQQRRRAAANQLSIGEEMEIKAQVASEEALSMIALLDRELHLRQKMELLQQRIKHSRIVSTYPKLSDISFDGEFPPSVIVRHKLIYGSRRGRKVWGGSDTVINGFGQIQRSSGGSTGVKDLEDSMLIKLFLDVSKGWEPGARRGGTFYISHTMYQLASNVPLVKSLNGYTEVKEVYERQFNLGNTDMDRLDALVADGVKQVFIHYSKMHESP